jgi:flagellar biogenesis protein FliO
VNLRWAASVPLLLLALMSCPPAQALEPAGGPPALEEDEGEAPDASVPDSAERSWLLDGQNAEPALDTSRPSALPGLGIVIAGTVLLGLGGAAMWLRQRRAKSSPLPDAEARLKVLATSRVGPKAYAVTASAGGRVMLLGVTDQQVSHLCWLDAPEPMQPELVPELKDELPDDYPGSALRASARVSGIPGPPEPHWTMSEGSLLRFQEVLRDAALDPNGGDRPSSAALTDAATILAEQTRDILSSVPPAPTAKRAASSGSRKRQRRNKSLAPVTPAPAAEEPSLEGQVAGLKALRKP